MHAETPCRRFLSGALNTEAPRRASDQLSQPALAVNERALPKIPSVDVKKIERIVDKPIAAALR
jgi:hypothetical protein